MVRDTVATQQRLHEHAAVTKGNVNVRDEVGRPEGTERGGVRWELLRSLCCQATGENATGLAEGVGFEPTEGRKPLGGFQDRCFRPLSHPSELCRRA